MSTIITKTLQGVGRSVLNQEVEHDELLALTARFAAAKSMFTDDIYSWVYDTRLVEGDLVVDGPLSLFGERVAALVVTGRLVVRGLYSDTDDPASGTFVLGDMEAADVLTAGTLNVAGSLTVHGGLVGDYNHYGAEVYGETRARFLHTEHHWFTFHGPVHIEHVLDRPRGKWPPTSQLIETPPTAYRALVVPEVFRSADVEDDELEIDHRALMKRLSSGAPILRA